MYEEATNNSLFLYFHTKGVTSNLNHQRNLLFEHTIKNYNIYTQEFKDNPNLEVAGLYPHEAGFIIFNFFWVRGDYILNYWNNPSKQTLNNRFIWEVFTGDEFCSKSNITTFSPVVGYEKHDKKSVLNDNRYPFNIY